MTPQEKAARFSAFQSIGRGLLDLGSKFGGKKWVQKLNRLKERAAAGDESAAHTLSVLGMSSMMLGAGLGTAIGNQVDLPMLGGAAGAALGAAPSLISQEKRTNVLLPGFAGERQAEEASETIMEPEKQASDAQFEEDVKEVRAAAYKYGFFTKIAELGMTPSEFTKKAISTAGGLMAAGAASKAGETAGGLGKWTLEKALNTVKTGLKSPLIIAPIAGMLLGGAYRGLTAPSYEEPEDLRNLERVALYKRLAREAMKKARRKQEKRLAMSSTEGEAPIKVPALMGAR